jgi:hypothetical protein
MSEVMPAQTPLLANRIVKQVGALIAYAQPGDAVFGCTLEPSDTTSLNTRIQLVDDDQFWQVTAAAILPPGALCVVAADGRITPGTTGAVVRTAAAGAVGYPCPCVPLVAASANPIITQPPVTLTDAAVVAVDAALSDNFHLLTTNGVGATRQLGAPTNLTPGMSFVVRVQQPASGGPCALTFNAIYKFPVAFPVLLSTPNNAVDLIVCYYDGTSILATITQNLA